MYDTNPPPPRKPGPRDFTVPVEGLGDFVFGYRKMADHIAIEVEFARLTQGVQPTPWLLAFGEWMSTLRILMVKAPNGFDLDELDPLDDGVFDQLRAIFRALREKEDSFRQGRKKAGEADRAGAGEQSAVLVPAEVQPVAAGSAVPGALGG